MDNQLVKLALLLGTAVDFKAAQKALLSEALLQTEKQLLGLTMDDVSPDLRVDEEQRSSLTAQAVALRTALASV